MLLARGHVERHAVEDRLVGDGRVELFNLQHSISFGLAFAEAVRVEPKSMGRTQVRRPTAMKRSPRMSDLHRGTPRKVAGPETNQSFHEFLGRQQMLAHR